MSVSLLKRAYGQLLVLILLSVTVTVAQPDLRLSTLELRQLANDCRTERIAGDLSALEAIGNRSAGAPGLLHAMSWAETRLRAMGFRILAHQRFQCTVPIDIGSTLTCRTADGQVIKTPIYAIWPNYVTPSFLPPGGLTAPLLDGKNGQLTDFDGLPITGKRGKPGAVVLMVYHSDSRWQNAASLGAGAVVFLPDHAATFQQNLAKFTQTPVQFPRFYLDDKLAAVKLRQAARDGVIATLTGGMRWQQAVAENLVAFLPAANPGPTTETLLICVNSDAGSVIPGLATGGQSAANLASTMTMLDAVCASTRKQHRKHNLMVLVDSARAQSTMGLREFAAVLGDLNATRKQTWLASGKSLTPRQQFIARKMADIDPWMAKRQSSLEIRLGRTNAAIAWLQRRDAPAAFTYHDAQPVTLSALIPEKDARTWLTNFLNDRVKQQQIATLSEIARAESREGVTQFTPDATVSPRVLMLRHRKAYYRRLTSFSTPEEVLAAMQHYPLTGAALGTEEVTPQLLLAELRLRVREMETELTCLHTSFLLRKQLEPLDITRAYILDLSAGDSVLTLDRDERVGGERTAPAPQYFEWTNSLAPLIKGNFEHLSIYAQHALATADREKAPIFDFIGKGTQQRQASPAPHGWLNGTLALAGVTNFTFVTGNDQRVMRMGPGDRIAHDVVALGNLQRQARTLALLLTHLLEDPELSPHYEKNTPWCSDVMGVVVKQDERAGPFPKLPVPNALVTLGGYEPIQGTIFTTRYMLADSQGQFRFDGIAGWIDSGNLQSFRFSPKTGMISSALDAGMASVGGYGSSFPLFQKDTFKRLVVFDGACVQMYDVLDPMLMQPLVHPWYSQINLIEGKEGSLDNVFRFNPDLPSSTLVGLVPREVKLKLVIGQKGFGNRMMLLGITGSQHTGEGYYVGDSLSVVDAPRMAAVDLWRLNDYRLQALTSKGIHSHIADKLHRESAQNLRELRKALQQHMFSRARYLERNIWGRELRAYPEILATIHEAVLAAVILLLFVAPWAVFMERVFLQSGSLSLRILGNLVFFTIAFALIYSLHPAFRISQTPIMILVAYVLSTLAMLAFSVIFTKYSAMMKEWQERVGGIHQSDISRAGALMVAFNLGLSNMARRRLRTVLGMVMLALLAFSVMTLTSVKPYRDTRKVPLARPEQVGYDGVLFRLYNWGVIDEETAANVEQDLGTDVQAVRRMWLMRSDASLMEGPFGQGSRFLFQRDNRYQTLNIALGFMPEEREFSTLAHCVTGRWLSGARDEVILPREAASALGIRDMNVVNVPPEQQVRIMFGSEALRVVGILDTGQADQQLDMGGTNLSQVDFFLSGINAAISSAADAKVLMLPVGDEVNVRFIPFANCALLPYGLVKDLGGQIRSIAFKFPAGADTRKRIDDLTSRCAMNLYAAIDGKPFLIRTANAQQVEGVGKMLFPMLLVALIIANLMLGTVEERKREIKMLGAVGLAPRHVSILYLAEATALGVMGVVIGLLGGLIVAQVSRTANVGVDLNYASVPTVLMGISVLVIVMLATLLPATRAARLATPSDTDKWNLPESRDGRALLELPFTMTRQNGFGVFAFLHEFLNSHWESTSADFRCTELLTRRQQTESGEDALMISAQAWLAPYDMRVSQAIELLLIPDAAGRLFRVRYDSRHTAGELGAWNRANYLFIDLLRRQFLIYRTLTEAQRARYVERAQEIFTEHGTAENTSR